LERANAALSGKYKVDKQLPTVEARFRYIKRILKSNNKAFNHLLDLFEDKCCNVQDEDKATECFAQMVTRMVENDVNSNPVAVAVNRVTVGPASTEPVTEINLSVTPEETRSQRTRGTKRATSAKPRPPGTDVAIKGAGTIRDPRPEVPYNSAFGLCPWKIYAKDASGERCDKVCNQPHMLRDCMHRLKNKADHEARKAKKAKQQGGKPIKAASVEISSVDSGAYATELAALQSLGVSYDDNDDSDDDEFDNQGYVEMPYLPQFHVALTDSDYVSDSNSDSLLAVSTSDDDELPGLIPGTESEDDVVQPYVQKRTVHKFKPRSRPLVAVRAPRFRLDCTRASNRLAPCPPSISSVLLLSATP